MIKCLYGTFHSKMLGCVTALKLGKKFNLYADVFYFFLLISKMT